MLSYRPISLLPVIAKLAERAAQKQMIDFMTRTNQLNENNSAYRKDRSTVTTIIQMMDQIHEAVDEKAIANIMTIDETAAFDTISHVTLDRKLDLYNFSQEARSWCQSFLTYRSQYVCIGSGKSQMKAVRHGVPQGSVLGPLLFSIYINKLPEVTQDPDNCGNMVHTIPGEKLFQSSCKDCGIIPSFADDSTVVTSGRSRELNQTKIVKNMEAIKTFLEDNQLKINELKTTLVEIMNPQKRIRTRGRPPYLDFINKEGEVERLKATKYTRILGFNVPHNLSLNAHFNVR